MQFKPPEFPIWYFGPRLICEPFEWSCAQVCAGVHMGWGASPSVGHSLSKQESLSLTQKAGVVAHACSPVLKRRRQEALWAPQLSAEMDW